MSTVPTVSNEAKMYKIMGELKRSNSHRAILHAEANAAIDEIEASIIANPTVEVLKTLLLRTMAIHGRDKTVCSYEYMVKQIKSTKEGGEELVDVWVTGGSQKMDIDEHDFQVSIVKGGTKVRVHLTKEAMKTLKTEWAEKEKHGKHRKIVFYD